MPRPCGVAGWVCRGGGGIVDLSICVVVFFSQEGKLVFRVRCEENNEDFLFVRARRPYH